MPVLREELSQGVQGATVLHLPQASDAFGSAPTGRLLSGHCPAFLGAVVAGTAIPVQHGKAQCWGTVCGAQLRGVQLS